MVLKSGYNLVVEFLTNLNVRDRVMLIVQERALKFRSQINGLFACLLFGFSSSLFVPWHRDISIFHVEF